MKKLFIIILLWCLAAVSTAAQVNPTARRAAIVHSKFQEEGTTTTATQSNARSSISYFDGLGNLQQTIGYKLSPTSNDIIQQAHTYDRGIRLERSYLPIPLNTSGAQYLSSYHSTAQSFYQDSYPYEEILKYDNTELEQVKVSRGVGVAWADSGKVKKVESIGLNNVKKITEDSNGNLVFNSRYLPSGSYGAEKISDEQGNSQTTVSSRAKQPVMIIDSEGNTTYFVYDFRDRLVAIIQPQAYDFGSGSIDKDSELWEQYVFGYEYDHRNRIIRKHIPGAGWTEYVYDKADRPVLQQDTIQRKANLWTFTKYDPFDRVAITGEYEIINNRSALQSIFDEYIDDPNEHWVDGEGYDAKSYPLGLNPVEGVGQFYFYDHYDFVDGLETEMGFKSSGAYHEVHSSAKGLLTGSVSFNQDSIGVYYVTALYYDDKGRLIQQQSSHPKTTKLQPDRIDYEYSFAGEVLREKRLYKTTNKSDQTLITRNEYDHAGRLIKTFISHNGLPEKEIIRYSYDEIGRLTNKVFIPNESFVLGNPDYIYRPPNPGKNQEDLAKKAIVLEPGTEIRADTLETYLAQIDSTTSSPFTGLQTMDYSWHIRGGLRGINMNPSGNPIPDITEGDLFAYKLDYEIARQWNGNIGKQSWNHVDGANPVGIRDYTYSYDGLDRLKSASFTGLTGENHSVSGLNYDRNGNITALKRYGKKGGSHGLTDNLSYTYNGNRLTKVVDAVSGNHEVDFVQRGSGNYTYYENGALKSDDNKEIENIVYNTFLNLPKEIYLTGGRWIKNTYLGDGTLVKREFSNGEICEYNNGLIFKNGEFYSIDIPEGRMVYNNGSWHKEFYYEDHLGNKRVAFTGESGTLVKKEAIDFDPWGVRLKGTDYNIGFEDRFKYQNKESLTLFGLENINDFSARYFDRNIGRFWGVDPLADHPNQLGISPYAFTNNNPVNMIDPDGKMAVLCCGEEDPTKDQFLFAKLAVTAFYDTKHAVYNTAFRIFRSDLRAEYKVENGNEVFETTFTRKTKDNSFSGILKEGAYALADGALILPGGNTTGKLFAQTSKSQGLRTAKNTFESATDLGLKDGMKVTSSKALDLAERFLGKGYKESKIGSGRYVSQDGKRVFRMGKNDITGAHGGGPHVNFETLRPNPMKPDKMIVDKNYHIYIKD